MEEDRNIIELDSSDSEFERAFGFDDPIGSPSDAGDQWAHTSETLFGQSGPQESCSVYNDHVLDSSNQDFTSSSQHASLQGLRRLPPLTNGGTQVYNNQHKTAANFAGRINPTSNSAGSNGWGSMEALPGSASFTAPGIMEDITGKRNNDLNVDGNKNNQRILPLSLTTVKNVGSTQLKSSAEPRGRSEPYAVGGVQRILSSSPGNGRSKGFDENTSNGSFFAKSTSSVGPITTNGIGMFASSASTLQKPSAGSQKASTNSDEDDLHVYGNTTSYRVFSSSVAPRVSAHGSELAGGNDLQNWQVMDNRHNECDERMIYQEALLNLNQLKSEDDLPDGVLSVPLLKHQKIALAWMVQKEKSAHCTGGILADDQGLGKTVSMIALIQKQMFEQSKFTLAGSNHVKSEALNIDEEDDGVSELNKADITSKNERKTEAAANEGDSIKHTTVENHPKREPVASSSSTPASHLTRPAAGTLVVCPASILKQWANELKEKVTEGAKLSVLVYHGGSRTKNPSDIAKYDVVVTTYTIVTNEVPKHSVIAGDDGEQKSTDKYGLSSDFSHNKKRKPASSAPSKGKKKGKKHKDSDFDYDSGTLARVRWFRVVLDEAQTIKNYRTQVARACCGLRAKRRWCLSGTPIQNAIDDLYIYFRFLKYDPYSAYSSFCSSIKHPISRNASHGYKKLQAVLRTVLLRRTKDTLINGEPIIKLPPKSIHLKRINFTTEERAFYLKLEEHSRQQFKAYAAAGTVKQNYANILLLLLRLRQACDHPLLAKGYQSDFVGKNSLEMASQLPRDMVTDLLNHLEGSLAICVICSDPPDDAVVAMCGHVFCYQCVAERFTSDENTCPASGCRETLSADSVFSKCTLRICVSDKMDSNATTNSYASDDGSSIVQTSYISSKIRATIDILKSICSTNSDNDPEECCEVECAPIQMHNTTNCSSSALNATSYISRCPKAPVKAIVFSQWTSMLNFLEMSLSHVLIQYRRLDGTMTLTARDRAVKDFNSDPEVRVMLMSLKAGNLGLNMVAACHVILLDLWWNPYAEDQAIDRVHRIGQTRPVTVSRLTIQDTVEDRILALQEDKRNMVSSAFGEDQWGNRGTRLTVEDLRYLFMV